MNLEIQDTGLGKTDPYVITENGKVLAQSYPNENGEHFQAGLREIVDEIATLRAQLAEAVEALKPFAHPDLSEILAGNTVGEESIVYVRNNATLTVKDFRRAAEIINRIIQSND